MTLFSDTHPLREFIIAYTTLQVHIPSSVRNLPKQHLCLVLVIQTDSLQTSSFNSISNFTVIILREDESLIDIIVDDVWKTFFDQVWNKLPEVAAAVVPEQAKDFLESSKRDVQDVEKIEVSKLAVTKVLEADKDVLESSSSKIQVQDVGNTKVHWFIPEDDYDTGRLEMEHYLEYIDNEVWKVIQNGNSKKRVTKDHLRRFHGMDDAKEIWAAIKTRFGGNGNSKKMQRKPVRTEKEALMTIDEGQINWVEQTTDEEINHALMAFTVNTELIDCGMSSTVKLVSNASSIVFSICPSNDSDGELGAVSNDSSTHYSTCQSNDSDGELGTVSDHSVNNDPIHDHIPIPSIEQVTNTTQKTQPQMPKPTQTVDPSCAQHVKSPRQPIRTPITSSPIPSNNRQNWNQRMERNLGAGYSFERKPCFVCGSLSHLIKDCDYYEKKMAREAALKSKRVIHADVRQATPAWTNTNRVNKANQFTPRPVQISNIRPNFSTASRTIKTGRVNVNTGKQNVSSGSLHVSSGTHVNSGSLHVNSGTKFKSGASRFNPGKQHVNSGSVQVNTGRVNRPVSNNTSSKSSQVNLKSPKKCFSKQRSPVNRHFSRYTAYKSNKYAVKGKMGTAVKTSAGCVWRKAIPLSNTNSGPTPNSNVTVSRGPQGRPKPVKAWVTRINWRILKNSIGDLLPLEVLCTNTTNGYQFTMSNQHKDWLVQEQTALGAKGLTSPEQTGYSLGDDASKQGRIDIGDINTDAEITLIDETQGRINDIIADEDITLIPKLIIKLLKNKEVFIPEVRRFHTKTGALLSGDHVLLWLINFSVYQMDVKSAFLYGTIDEEVYVSQPLVSDIFLKGWISLQLRNVIKDEMTDILNTSVQKPMYKESNALNKLESQRLVSSVVNLMDATTPPNSAKGENDQLQPHNNTTDDIQIKTEVPAPAQGEL
ncbi:hypothetical protein Tco_1045332 [Tanacetum coccineum]|uniref:Reverse transcriptase Ty1/copia-type domain-containing protein n=1 Tax=Tanacetum coccineum TaxID=301880 RepID=A0ABQ5GUM5_9ASTR